VLSGRVDIAIGKVVAPFPRTDPGVRFFAAQPPGGDCAQTCEGAGSYFSTFVPHSAQNFAPGLSLAPHFVQRLSVAIFAPHSGQNLTLAGRGALQLGQVARTPSRHSFSLSISRSSSATWECAQISSTTGLGRSHFYSQIRGTVLAQTFLLSLTPPAPPADLPLRRRRGRGEK